MANPFRAGDDASGGGQRPVSVSRDSSRRGVDVIALVDEFAALGEGARERGSPGSADGGASGTRRRTREVSAEERINETASAVIQAGTASGGSAEAFVGSSDDAAFSDRLAIATAKIATLAAQLKAKTETARLQRQNEVVPSGKELLRQLQEAAASRSESRTPGLVSVQSMRRGEHATGENPAVRDGKVVKGLGYKLGAASRRTSQRLLQNFGAERTSDNEFKALWSSVQKQEQILAEICSVSQAYKEAQRSVFQHSKRMAELVRELVETGDKSNTWEGAPALAREAAMREACKMVDVADALVTRCTPLTEEVFDWNILDPTNHRRQGLPGYKACVAKRKVYMQDMDAFDRQLAAAQKRGNSDEMSVKEEQARRARQRFNDFSSKLVEELCIVDGLRYEMAYSLVRGFANVQCFNLERQLDVARALRGSSSS